MLILVVDDDHGSRKSIKRICERQGHQVISAENADEALQLLRTNRAIRIVITDNDMPNMTGIEMIRMVQPQMLNIKFILVSGKVPDNIPPGIVFFQKPHILEGIVSVLKETQ
ncbi:response regulator [Patescibacteria group bacterium]